MAAAEQKGCFHEASFVDEDGRFGTQRVPVVQELARQGLHHLPHCFVRPQADLPVVLSSPITHQASEPPVINMANLALDSESDNRARELAKLARAAEEWGLFLLDHHGIPSEVLCSVKEVVSGFFSLPFDEKKASVGTHRSVDNMGYGRNFVKLSEQPLDWIDRLNMRAAPNWDSEGLDVWPRKPVNFRQIMESYVEEARRVLDELLQALAEALALHRGSFLRYFEPNQSVINIRVNYYPPCPSPELVLGITPHSDPSGLTILLQSHTTGGLQVFKDLQWLTVSWPKDTLLVNIGDLLEIMSNGRAQSPWHRVVTQKDQERFSVALFYNPPLQAEIGPVRGDESSEFDYRKVVVEEYVQHFYKVSPTKEKQAIMFARTKGVI